MREIKIDQRVIKHLGEELVTSPEIAVIELVKNAIDAEAKNINIYVQYNALPAKLADIVPVEWHNKPFLLVEDDGIGMTDKVIDEGFLTVATSIKSNMSNVLGQKGIGRLATQRLGSALLVETTATSEDHTSYVYIDWRAVVAGNNKVTSYETTEKEKRHYTRLWIFGINIEDYISNAIQFEQLFFDDVSTVPVQINRNLKSALNFLILPFDKNNSAPAINFYFDNRKVDISFPQETLKLAESVHQFEFTNNDNEMLHIKLTVRPWFIERVHRALVKPEAFNRLKKSHDYYSELLQRSISRIDNVLNSSISKEVLFEQICDSLKEIYFLSDDDSNKKELYESFIGQKANEVFEELIKISPINGKIYSFKQGAAIGDKIVIDAASKLGYIKGQYSLNDLKHFLEDYNGIKLYRGINRIGYLGNKESDWIKLQQFRTKGQQWYRFDLGNTVGFVSLSDASQKNIQEISSRLDINENKTSGGFKLLINIVFNKLFYNLNKNANDICKVLLSEEGLLGENLAKRVKRSDADLKEMIRRNTRMQKALKDVFRYIEQGRKIDGTDQIALPEKSYVFVKKSLKKLDSDIQEDSIVQGKTAVLLSEADAQLKAIEVESYNNYKLMANGLITETITHELHSLSNTGISPETEEHFGALKEFFVSNDYVPTYNHHVVPIHNSYLNISAELEHLGDLYSFLEKTFIKKGTIDEFVQQNINSTINDITRNIKKDAAAEDISIVCRTGELAWFAPKGVLLHVFYNLISNSIYWIDKRRKMAQSDPFYASQKADEILIEDYGIDGIIVSDTGTGVIHNMEDILFEPLQSGKPNPDGRGMGLYIVRKLLNSFGGEIELMEDRNQYGNRYKFLLLYKNSEELV